MPNPCAKCGSGAELIRDKKVLGKLCPVCLFGGLINDWPETRLTDEGRGVLAGQSLDKYDIHDLLGYGGMGAVYRATHKGLNKPVALKVLSLPGEQQHVDRFRREATVAARLKHPNIVEITDVGTRDGTHYIAMDLVTGVSLRQWVSRQQPDRTTVLRLMAKVAGAVAHAHEHGVLHRDLKPENILVRAEGEPVVVDFGLARSVNDILLTREGMLVGTPAYMSPEQVRGENQSLDAGTDIHALGVILYEALTGRLPFSGTGEADMYRQILESDVPAAGLSPDIDTVISKCLEKEPGRRYASAQALSEDLRRCADGEPIQATRVSPVARVWRRFLRNPRRVALLVTVGLIVGVVFFLIQRGWTENRELHDALEIQSAYTRIEAATIDLMSRIERARYGLTDRGTLLTELDRILAREQDGTGVAESFRLWARFLLREPGTDGRYTAALKTYPDNPFVPLIHTRFHLRQYAEQAQYPGTLLSFKDSRNPVRAAAPIETPAMTEILSHARADLKRARSSRIWKHVPELAGIAELVAGYTHFAEGRMSECADVLVRARPTAGFALETGIVLIMVYGRLGQPDEAIERAEQLDRKFPKVPPVLLALQAALRQRGVSDFASGRNGLQDLEKSRSILGELKLLETASGASVDLLIGVGRLESGDAAGALREIRSASRKCEALLLQDPDNVFLLANSAICRERLARFGEVPEGFPETLLTRIRKALSLDPENDQLRFIRAQLEIRGAIVRHKTGRPLDAELEAAGALIGKLEKSDWSPNQIRYLRATWHAVRGDAKGREGLDDYRQALKLAERILTDKPDDVDALHVSIRCRMALAGDVDEILAVAKETREIDSPNRHWTAGLMRDVAGWLDRKARRFPENEGEAVAREAVRVWALIPETRSDLLGHADAMYRLAERRPADVRLVAESTLAAYEKIASKWPDDADAHHGASLTHTMLAFLAAREPAKLSRHLELGLKSASRALELRADRVDTILNRSRIYSVLRRPDEAMEDLERVLELSPDHPEALVRRAGILITRNRLEEAVLDLETAWGSIARNPTLAPFADKSARMAVQATGDTATGLVLRARCRILLGQIPQARKDLHRARSLGADGEEIDRLLKNTGP